MDEMKIYHVDRWNNVETLYGNVGESIGINDALDQPIHIGDTVQWFNEYSEQMVNGIIVKDDLNKWHFVYGWVMSTGSGKLLTFDDLVVIKSWKTMKLGPLDSNLIVKS